MSTQMGTVPETTRTQFLDVGDDLLLEADLEIRDYRYGEIIPVFTDGSNVRSEVYNSLTFNKLPADLWEALDVEAMKQEYGAIDIKMNAPRYFVLDKMKAGGKSNKGKTVDFGGIEMSLVAVIDTKLGEAVVGGSFYTVNEVQRTTIYTFFAGSSVYELTNPDGEVFRMQSYAQILDPTLSIDDLDSLGDRLTLPEGWSYEARVLDQESQMIVDGLAYVINDNLVNSYQKV